MGYVENLLVSDERVVYQARKHWIAPIFATVTGSLLAIGGLVAVFSSLFTSERPFADTLLSWGGWLALLAGLILLARAFVVWWSILYLVTNHKVMKVSGILRKTATGAALEKINDTMIEQTALGRLLDFGTVAVLTAADESNLRYRLMAHPVEFRRAILDAKQDWEQEQANDIADAFRRGHQQATPGLPRPGQTAEEITALIGQLARLRDAGAITNEEFEAKKAELLDRL